MDPDDTKEKKPYAPGPPSRPPSTNTAYIRSLDGGLHFHPSTTFKGGAISTQLGVTSTTFRDSTESPWKRVMEEAGEYGDGGVKGWKEELATNLFLAGLLTLTLALFTIESLPTQISRQIGNPTNAVPSTNTTFQPSSSVIRINCFLSLTIAMVSTLVGLLCRQWLSDHFQETHTRTPEESIALQRLRIDALHRWGVVLIMRALPVCLQMALLLFFAGLMELLWLRNTVVFAIAVAVAGTAFYIYVPIAFLPTILAVQQVLSLRGSYDAHNPKNLLDHSPQPSRSFPSQQ
ncbi:hypothetical protein PQX77_009529 [Marasmius sp. AFHP31]|nr:hypothetical protein PQX77_009529 [Marasmius sp. AFHP31]